MNAEIIGVGSELLLGQIANTDAQFISGVLSQMGIDVYFHTVVGDNKKRLLSALSIAEERSDIIITTGGLGPTMDDLTKETVCEYLGLNLYLHDDSLKRIEEHFNRVGRPCTENNKKQAMFPKQAIVLENDNGTAPGMIVKSNNKTFIVLPGPPYELEPMFNNYVMPHLETLTGQKIFSKVIKLYGIGESSMETRIIDLLENQSNPTIAPLAKYGEVTLRLTAKCKDGEDPEDYFYPIETELGKRFKENIYGYNDDTLNSVVVDLMLEQGIKLSIAESCTGGLIAKYITDISGSSNCFEESFITYSNESKIKNLRVKKETIDKYGAVSYQTAYEMVKGLVEITDSNVGIAVTGIAGPSGGSVTKPVGLVYIAVAMNGCIEVKEFKFSGDRFRVRDYTAKNALNWLRLKLINKT